MDLNIYGKQCSIYRRHVWLLQFKRTRRDLFMSFPTLDRLVILTAEHVYSGRPGNRFSVHGLLRSKISQQTCYLLSIQCLTGVTETWFILLTIFGGKSCAQNNWSFGYYAVRRPFLAKVPAIPLLCFVPSSAYMTHATPLPTWCECRVSLSWGSACGYTSQRSANYRLLIRVGGSHLGPHTSIRSVATWSYSIYVT